MSEKYTCLFFGCYNKSITVACIKIERMTFKELHYQEKPLLLANVWDVPSTKVAEKLGFQAIGTSSWAVAALLGYEDGEKISFSELEFIVKRIAANTNLPLSVDLEAGYSRYPVEIADHIKRLADMGVVGVNFEDSVIGADGRAIMGADDFTRILRELNGILQKDNVDVFMNVRTDSFLLGHDNALEESKKRISLYEDAGASGIFTPCIQVASDIKDIVASTSLPVNVLCMPNLPDFDTLNELGVKRISMGNFLFSQMYTKYEKSAELLLDQRSFKSVF